MNTIKCDVHDALIVLMEPDEEAVFSSSLNATVVFRDSRGMPYLKRYRRGECDENCSTIIRFKKAASTVSKVEVAAKADA